MEFRLVGPRDEEVKWLWDYCFEKKNHPFFQWYFSRYSQEGNVLAGYADGKLATCLHLNPCDIFLRGQFLPVSYIVGLGVTPEARGGAAGELLSQSLVEMRRRGHWVSIIMPARAGTYYPYQWELCYHQYRYSIAPGELKTVGAKWGSFRLFDLLEDITRLDAVYRQFVGGLHGYANRGEDYWRQIVEEHYRDNGYIYLLEHGGEVQGYLFYKLNHGRLQVREMAYTCIEALRGMIWFFYQHISQAQTVEWNAPQDDWLHFLLPDPKRVVTLEPFMAARIVDVAEALAVVDYPEGIDANIGLAVEDEQAPWNNRTFVLEVSGRKGRVSRPDQSPAETVRITIGALTQLLFGRLTAVDLAKMGRLHAKDSAALALLDRLFPRCTNYINEYY